MGYEVTHLFAGQCQLAEGVIWQPKSHSLMWVDIYGNQVHQLSLPAKEHRTWSVGEYPSSILPSADGRMLLTQRKGLNWFRPEQGSLEPIFSPEAGLPANRYNDAQIDPRGRLWAGTMAIDADAPSGRLYRYSPGGAWRQMESDFFISNGPVFSPCGRVLYYADSLARTVYHYELDRNCDPISERRHFITLPEGEGVPDGMTCDIQGNLWICHFDGGGISRYSPSGQRIGWIDLPVSKVASCTFGGSNMSTLFITTAQVGLSPEALAQQPLAGDLFCIETDTQGQPQHRFAQATSRS
ncbi:SMP-30/gluconolactonase/LRE family protein [Ferrimonas marina]|uniref:Sugar lactone lactonase YvrE n=1 Tax=Ferrimonas marina TaxID=299255 RepID=A0A1M5NDP0_9GAMM|nr:SMP-30/gluconolactonase/LRE family protein [Ferrimonas marina]SHG87631.1 Sugar lactone lactonase YvrE [Ferrimonas marina]